MKYMHIILPVIALLAVACLASLEITLMYDHSAEGAYIKMSWAFCIAAVGALRYILFLSSSALWQKRSLFGWIAGGMSLAATLGLIFYVENISGLEPNVRLIYHMLNLLIAAAEIAAAMILSPVNDSEEERISREELESEVERLSDLLSIAEANLSKKDEALLNGDEMITTLESKLVHLQRENGSLQIRAEKWSRLAGKVGVVHRKSSRYMAITPDGLIVSVDSEGNRLDADPSAPIGKKAKLNGVKALSA